MYFPYLRGRQNELLALNQLSSVLSGTLKVLPIIEPVKAQNYNAFRSLARNKVPFVLIVNPTVGDLQGASGQAVIENKLINGSLSGSTSYYLGIIITANTSLAQIDYFLRTYPDHPKVIIHKAIYSDTIGLLSLLSGYKNIEYQVFIDNRTSTAYQNKFISYQRILLKDGFVKSASNATYEDSDLFCDIHTTYSSLGFQGFGDFLTIGDEFKEGGMSPFVVAIHLTYLDGDVYVGHFLSDATSKSRADTAGKFSEALSNLISFVNHNGMAAQTLGIQEFEDLHIRGHYPGLGQVKKASMKHHIEFIMNLI
ncbi:sce7725 family protein [Spirosoma foliorum]|uniref:Sce7725 family protein n=1 Tax=Spirosoma foliorum TaxID=2710596 RepID=A0A7G5GZ01_9BACT|nr:sce7725 family protein [Spirosoma foliorum]QMW04093.1 sce7725 family protein [Spirosoma foliorum]